MSTSNLRPLGLSMKYCLLFTLLTVVLSMFTACKGQIDGNDNWIGLWSGNKDGEIYFLDIKQINGSSSYEKVGDDPVFGTIRINEQENELKIGDRVFEINQIPILNELTNKWEVRVEEVSYVRN